MWIWWTKINRNPSILGCLSVIKWRNWIWESYLNTEITDETEVAVVVWPQWILRQLNASEFEITCKGVKATLEAVPDTCFFTVVLPPHVWFIMSDTVIRAILCQLFASKSKITCKGVKATLEAVPDTCFFTVVLPPHVWFCLLIFCWNT